MKLLGLRVVARTEDGEDWGVARVRYNIPHQHCRKYEIERPDGSAFLAEYSDCRPAPNWDDTPEQYRVGGSEFYRPKFLAGATVQNHTLFGRDHGVVVPSDLAALRRQVAGLEPGQKIGFYSHGCNEFRGELVIGSVTDAGITMRGGKGAHPTRCTWPTSGEPEMGPQSAREFLVEPGKIRFLRVPPRRTGKGVSDSVTITF